uniref:TNFR-Cys domain-containing protein n=1 Tax=Hucho hucho TaxID=62062 RepID=A0A4W5JTR6_9TELE
MKNPTALQFLTQTDVPGTYYHILFKEYRIGDECCPMCSLGRHVHKHCTEFTSTSCVPCVDSTFLDEPNGLMKCKVCTNCDAGFGLMVKQPCTPSPHSVCGPLEGLYCLDPTKDGCRAAQRHSSCKPGQYISHTDSLCLDSFAHSWHSLNHLHEVVTWIVFQLTGLPC